MTQNEAEGQAVESEDDNTGDTGTQVAASGDALNPTVLTRDNT